MFQHLIKRDARRGTVYWILKQERVDQRELHNVHLLAARVRGDVTYKSELVYIAFYFFLPFVDFLKLNIPPPSERDAHMGL